MQQHDIATLDITEIGQTLFERLCKRCADLRRKGKHMAYSPDLARLLSSSRGGQRPCRNVHCADELPPSHSMTSSARARIEGGTVRPSASAVFRLTTSSNRVGCWTGRSAGFAPLRIFPA